ncbi:hypothetical protein GQ43DRAFT_121903 [Delitschia confertaspora ATCC 74209]|uniref:Uncharacterized protein n=1 Tax=Delitschia confertaspora ATCC 74209 TaxID=1513339 RepID=A0A9P4JUU7_9PLEO|nr:hypothetical protein GQ43DRAFT_121903 [Delitschia confertaspora ATCC 74209]
MHSAPSIYIYCGRRRYGLSAPTHNNPDLREPGVVILNLFQLHQSSSISIFFAFLFLDSQPAGKTSDQSPNPSCNSDFFGSIHGVSGGDMSAAWGFSNSGTFSTIVVVFFGSETFSTDLSLMVCFSQTLLSNSNPSARSCNANVLTWVGGDARRVSSGPPELAG